MNTSRRDSSFNRLIWTAVAIGICLVVIGRPPVKDIKNAPLAALSGPVEISQFFCGGLDRACCRPPASAVNPAVGPLVACNTGLGCDITTNTCVQPCGAAGQVCCDGPETRAPKWTADGRIYSPNYFDMREMCLRGACDVKSHRCFDCGTTDGGACCPPDAAQATARCLGRNLNCVFSDDFATSGNCVLCGALGKRPCEHGCDTGLKIRLGLCAICGAVSQLPCDAGCDRGLATAQGLCRQCGAAGQLTCDRGCNPGTVAINGICTTCGANGQPACAQGCTSGFTVIGGVCLPCGANGQPPCDKRCNSPLKVANGVCRSCGAAGQIPCDIGCNPPLIGINGLCATRQEPPQQQCAIINEACVPATQPGRHCCQQTGAPLSCVWQKCVQCVPHGEVCQLRGTQVCCSYNDTCVLDPATGNAVCDLPDGPDQ